MSLGERPGRQAELGDRRRRGRLDRQRSGRRRRVHGPVQRGAAGRCGSREHPLREGDPGGRPLHRRGPPRWGARHGETGGLQPPLLHQAGPHRSGEQRQDRPGANRGLHRRRRLSAALPRAPRDEARRCRGHHHQERLARPRRRGLPHRPEVGPGRQGQERAEIHHLQRGRGRSGRLHGSQRPGKRPAPRAGRHGHRGLRRRGHPGLRLCSRRVSAGHQPVADRHPAGPEARPPGQPDLRVPLRFPHRPPHRRGRLRLRRRNRPDGARSRASAARPARARPTRPSTACGASRR